MSSAILKLLVTAAAVSFLVSAVSAQGITVSGGATLVHGPVSVWAGHGTHASIGVEVGHSVLGSRFRVDALYSQLPGNNVTRSPATERTYGVLGAVVFRVPNSFRVRPYVLLGAGLYGHDSWSHYTPGVNAGAGIEVSRQRVRPFAEARLHQYWRDARRSPPQGRGVTLAPISVGVRF